MYAFDPQLWMHHKVSKDIAAPIWFALPLWLDFHAHLLIRLCLLCVKWVHFCLHQHVCQHEVLQALHTPSHACLIKRLEGLGKRRDPATKRLTRLVLKLSVECSVVLKLRAKRSPNPNRINKNHLNCHQQEPACTSYARRDTPMLI